MASELSDFEYGWAACPDGHAMVQHRRWSYDRQSALLYAPTVYEYEPVSLASSSVDDQWIVELFLSFVRGEFQDDLSSVPTFPGVPEVIASQPAEKGSAETYLAQAESLVYGGYLDGLLTTVPDRLSAQVHAILSDKRLGHPRNSKNISEELIESWLEPVMAKNHRIRLIMPAFPFKDQNPFRTTSRPSSPDISEVAMMVHLYLITQALYQVHPHGVDWVLLCDGVAYSDIFGVEAAEAEAYRKRLRDWRERLNLTNTISIVDLAELALRADGTQSRTDSSSRRGAFTSMVAALQRKLTAAVDDGQPDIMKAFSVLKRGMAWNLNSRDYLRRTEMEDLWFFLKSVGHPDASLSPLAREIDDRAHDAAIRYASFNIALRRLDLIEAFIPGAVRATIHPKPNQVAVPRLGKTATFPWNGVAVLQGDVPMPGALTVDALHSHNHSFPRLMAYIDNDTGDPFYFAPG